MREKVIESGRRDELSDQRSRRAKSLGEGVDLRHADAPTERRASRSGNGVLTRSVSVETRLIGACAAIAGFGVLLLLLLVLTVSKRTLKLRLIAHG